jgi:hypothetical protein
MAQPKQRSIRRGELAAIKHHEKSVRFVAGCDVVKALLKYGMIFGSVWAITKMAAQVSGRPAEAIQAMAGVFTALGAGQWIPFLVGGGGVVYGVTAQRRNKGLVRQVDALRKTIEGADPQRSSSGLTAVGTTPRREERT